MVDTEPVEPVAATPVTETVDLEAIETVPTAPVPSTPVTAKVLLLTVEQ